MTTTAESDGASRGGDVMVVLSDGVLNRCDPLGARCIMTVIEACGRPIADLLEDRLMSRSEIGDRLAELRPPAVWVSVQPDTHGVGEFVEIVAARACTRIILGNVGARHLRDEDIVGLNSPLLCVLGQGEDATQAICEALEDRSPDWHERLKDVPNVRVMGRGGHRATISAPSALAMVTVPSSLFLRRAVARGDVMSARASSGCNSSCTFCTVRAINNGQRWRALETSTLVKWLESLVEAGMTEGVVRMVDDDLAGRLDNLAAVAEAFRDTNERCGARLGFGFSTRASHIWTVESPEDATMRRAVWQAAAEAGLRSVFIGLESGSPTQLRRFGKGLDPSVNFEAINVLRHLEVGFEAGFIPIDPMMSDESWREEMRDNLVLAHFAAVQSTSPTWLAPARVYRESPLSRWAAREGLLGPVIGETGEHECRFKSSQVAAFVADLGPALCAGTTNGLYRFKREFKNFQRYPAAVLEDVSAFGEALVLEELAFVEALVATDGEERVRARRVFRERAIELLGAAGDGLRRSSAPHAAGLLVVVSAASDTMAAWAIR